MPAHGSACQVPGAGEDSAAVGAGAGNPGAETQELCGVTLWAALKQWPLWATAAVLLLLLVLCFLLLFGPVSSGREKYSSSNMDETANDKGNNAVAKKVLETSPDTQS